MTVRFLPTLLRQATGSAAVRSAAELEEAEGDVHAARLATAKLLGETLIETG